MAWAFHRHEYHPLDESFASHDPITWRPYLTELPHTVGFGVLKRSSFSEKMHHPWLCSSLPPYHRVGQKYQKRTFFIYPSMGLVYCYRHLRGNVGKCTMHWASGISGLFRGFLIMPHCDPSICVFGHVNNPSYIHKKNYMQIRNSSEQKKKTPVRVATP